MCYSICWVCVEFDDFLHSLNEFKKWDEHLKHMLIFCQIHVKRNFAKKISKHSAHYIAQEIWDSSTIDVLLQYIESICQAHSELKSWIINKRSSWILADLSKERFKISHQWWTYARKHSEISESSHFQDNNFTRRNISLLNVVLR